MAKLELSPGFRRNLHAMITSHELPGDTWERVREQLAILATFPNIGVALDAQWQGYRLLLGPWDWMLIVYQFDEGEDLVLVATVQDARRARSARQQ